MPEKRHEDLADLSVIGVDIGKDTFHLVGFDSSGKRGLGLKIRRLALQQVFEKLPRCVVGMEACLSAHFVSWTLRHSALSRGSSRRST
jgi:transposase